MTQDLPSGLVTPAGTIGSELDGFHAVAVEDIAQLWRVYTTHSSVQQNGDPSRLENLFWRIWGSSQLQKTLTGSTLSMLFLDISEDRPLRTTPRQSPPTAAKKTSDVTPGPVNMPAPPENAPSAAHSVGARIPLPSILKKPNAGRSSSNTGEPSSLKMTRILIPESAGHKMNAPPAPTRGSSATEKPGRKKPAFVASTSKRRPVVMRRKSSQTSSTEEVSEDSLLASESTETKADGPLQNPVIPEERDDGARRLSWASLPYMRLDDGNNQKGTPPSPPISSSRSSPPPVRFSTSSIHHHRSPERKSSSTDQEELTVQSSTSLVDQDFRTQFAERRRQDAASGCGGATDDGASSSLANPASSSYLKSLIASSLDVSQPRRGGSRSLSPAARHLMMPRPSSSRSRKEGEGNQSGEYHPDNTNTDSTLPNNNNNKQHQRQQPHRTNYASAHGQQQQPSVQSTSASGVFSLPNFPQTNHHLTSMVERSRHKSPNRS